MLIKNNKVDFQSPRGFIVLEGVNGAGKSTLQRLICKKFTEFGLPFVSTFEPGDTEAGKAIRELVLSRSDLSSMTELFLFAADRKEHVEKKIRPALDQAQLVICDRYVYSTIAFQGYGRGLTLSTVNEICHLAVSGVYPDLVILLDLDPKEGLKRAQQRQNSSKDSFEQEKSDFHTRLRDGFLQIAHTSPEPFLVLDATKPPETLCDEAMEIVQQLLSRLGR